MRVTHVQSIFSVEHGGPAYSLAAYCAEQVKRECAVSLRVLDGFKHGTKAKTLDFPVDQKIFPVTWPEKLGFSWRFHRFLRTDPSPDVYHLHGAWHLAMTDAAATALKRDRPYIVEMMGSYTDYELDRKSIRKSLARAIYQDDVLRRAACIHVNSTEEGRMLRRRGFNTPIACLPVGVDLGETDRVLSKISGVKRIRARPYVLYLGRIHPTKGVSTLITVWESMRQSAKDWQLVIAGTGDPAYVAECQRLSADMIASGDCEWVGRVTEDEKVRLYRDAGAYVLPSLNENFGNTVAEALACATPVITTFNTQWHMLEQRECGWLAESEAASLRQAIERCVDGGEAERSRRGALGREFVEREFSIEIVVSKMIEIYRGVIEGAIPEHLLMQP